MKQRRWPGLTSFNSSRADLSRMSIPVTLPVARLTATVFTTISPRRSVESAARATFLAKSRLYPSGSTVGVVSNVMVPSFLRRATMAPSAADVEGPVGAGAGAGATAAVPPVTADA